MMDLASITYLPDTKSKSQSNLLISLTNAFTLSMELSEIFKVFSFDDLSRMYYTLHEADITKFVDLVDARIKEVFSETNLKRIRTSYGCTQLELSKKSGVSLRSIQMYEQRNKDINKASVETVYRLAKVLGCEIEELIEK